jgi:hypothetical protein
MRKALLAILLLISSPAWGGGSGGDLYAACTSASGTRGDVICSSYINGFANGVLMDQIAREKGTPICIPDGVTTIQVREAVKNYLAKHPVVLGIDSGSLVGVALMEAYPCPKSN